MTDMDDTLSSSLIDALSIFSKTRLRETGMLELIDGKEVDDLFEGIKEGRLTSDDFSDISDPSLIWSAIIKGFEATPIFTVSTTNSSPDDVVHRVSDSYKRACGPLICTTELLLEYFPHNSNIIVASLQKAFVSPIVLGHSNATSFLLHIVEDYKMYFPYTYTFCRRIGKSPNVTLQDWKDTFFPPSSTGSNNQDKGGELNTSGIQDFSLDNWDMSGLEEGEDSDDDSHHVKPRVPTVRAKKTTTRMRKKNSNSNASPSKNSSVSASSKNRSRSPLNSALSHPTDASFDSFIEVQELLSVHNDDDDDDSIIKSPVTSKNKDDGDYANKDNMSLDLSMASNTDGQEGEKVTLVDLRAVFEQTLDVGDFLADKGKLSRNLKYNSDVPSMADVVMRFHDSELSWDELQELATPYLRENRATLASSFDSSDGGDGNVEPTVRDRQETVVVAAPSNWNSVAPSARKMARKSFEDLDNERVNSDNTKNRTFKSDWSNTRTHQNFLVDSIEIEKKVKKDSKVDIDDDKKDYDDRPSQQLSPYLSLPKQPPTMSLVQEGEYMFQEIDRDGDGVVSKIELIKALRVNSPLAKKLNLSKQIRQEDGSRDAFMGVFHSMDKDGSADISIDEFTAFLKQKSEEDAVNEEKDSQKALLSDNAKQNVSKTVVSKTTGGNAGSDAWSKKTTDSASTQDSKPSSKKSSALSDPIRLSTTSEDILDRVGNGGSSTALVPVVDDSRPQSKSPSNHEDAEWKKNDDNEETRQDSPPRMKITQKDAERKRIHAIPKPKPPIYQSSSSDVEDLELPSTFEPNGEDEPDSFEKGRLALISPKKNDTSKPITQKENRAPGLTAKKFLEKHKKAKSERIVSTMAGVDNADNADNAVSGKKNLSKSVDFSDQVPEFPKDLSRTQSESDGQKRPPLPLLKASLSSVTNAKIASFRIQGQKNDGLCLTSSEKELYGSTSSCLPPPQTELGAVMGVVLEGWLEKKSSITGLFQKRYVVLAFGKASHMYGGRSSTSEDYMELRIFKRAVEAAWGYAPIELKRVIALDSVEKVEAHANKKKIDAIFTITERMVIDNIDNGTTTDKASSTQKYPDNTSKPTVTTSTQGDGVISVTRNDSFNSVNSDHHWADKARVVTLRASNPETRLLWITTLRKAMEVHP